MKHLISLAIVFLLLSCENDDQPGLISAGIETRISGHITSINGESKLPIFKSVKLTQNKQVFDPTKIDTLQ